MQKVSEENKTNEVEDIEFCFYVLFLDQDHRIFVQDVVNVFVDDVNVKRQQSR